MKSWPPGNLKNRTGLAETCIRKLRRSGAGNTCVTLNPLIGLLCSPIAQPICCRCMPELASWLFMCRSGTTDRKMVPHMFHKMNLGAQVRKNTEQKRACKPANIVILFI